MNKIKDHLKNKSIWASIVLVLNILRLVVQSLSEYSSLIQELLLYWVMTQQVNELIKFCVGCSPSEKWTLFC
jgi:hypothetical protein